SSCSALKCSSDGRDRPTGPAGAFPASRGREMPSPPADRHLRLYRAALVLYPRSFRRSYREPMLQLFGDCVRDVGAKAWLRAAPDLVRTVPAQRIEAVMNRLHLSSGARVVALALIVLGAAVV